MSREGSKSSGSEEEIPKLDLSSSGTDLSGSDKNSLLQDADPRISELKDKHDSLESKLSELHELNRQRDEELRSIKETIGECKTKVLALKTSICNEEEEKGERGCIGLAFYEIYGNFTWSNPGNWKMATGLFLLLYVFTNCCCGRFLPSFPKVFGFLYAVTLFYHFVFITAIPIVKKYVLPGRIDEGTFQKLDETLIPISFAVQIGLTTISLLLLQLRKCEKAHDRCCVKNGIQMILLIANYILELAAFSYVESLNNKGEVITRINQISGAFLAFNIILTLSH